MRSVEGLLERLVAEFQSILAENLVGIYLHGSLAMGCFNPIDSDIDFLVVVSQTMTHGDKRRLVEVLVRLTADAPVKGFETSVILSEDARRFKYPTPYLLHFSNDHIDRYRAEPDYICEGSGDKDLAAHMTIVYHRGRCLVGQPIAQVFGGVPRKYYIDSLLEDIGYAKMNMRSQPVYLILNLCRVLYYLRDGAICSKQEGGEWGSRQLPEQYREMVNRALDIYTGRGTEGGALWCEEQLRDFVEYMQREIKGLTNV